MEIGLAVGGSVLSSVLQVVFDRIAPNQEFLGLFQRKRKPLLNRLEVKLRPLYMVLEDAENKQAESSAVKSWFNKLKHAVYQAEDLLDEINTERLRGNLSNKFIRKLSPRLEEICDELESFEKQIGVLGLEILYAKQKGGDRQPSTSVVIRSQIFGRDEEKEKMVQMVLSGEGATKVSVIPITGMGGIGKTTLAQHVYDDDRVKNHFETKAWVCVSEKFDVYRTTKDLLMGVNSSVVDEKDDLNRLQVKLRDNIEGKRFIIILDDIWNNNYDDCQSLMLPLKLGSQGSKIIVTTRNENIAVMLQNEPFPCLQPIPGEQSWSLFKLHAFDNRAPSLSHEFEPIGKKIVEKCKGLPLAIKTVAGTLRLKSNIHEWHDILNSDIWMNEDNVLPALSLSYKHLPSHLKCCFAFCAVFPKDVPFSKEEVALLWMANDLVQPSTQKLAQNYFEELRSRSFFEMVNNKKYLMHDLVNDLARYVSGNFCARLEDCKSKDLQRGIQGENDLPPEVLHFSYLSSDYDTLKRFRGLAQVQGLRTFLPVHQSGDPVRINKLIFAKILLKLRHIRALSLHEYGFSVIPNSIGDLKHLRFLNLGGSDIKKLPNGITKCLNLQTLILARCEKLKELPEDMGLLINLQHLDISGCRSLIGKMERCISKLKDIQNLSIVVDEIHGSSLEQLDKLQLGQILKISGLDDAVTAEMAKSGELKNKNCIENLTLEWRGNPECSEDELNIFAELMPHTNIRQLSIQGYRGTTFFSSWLGDPAFCNIESLTLKDCKHCFHLPPLGQLTGLKRLEISGMDGITEVGEEFYGNSSLCKPFQVLEELRFSNMAEWTTWNTHLGNTEFLSLKDFRISNCPKLVGDIPFHLTSLRRVEMEGLHSLRCNLEEGSFLSSTLQETQSSNMLRLKKMTQGIEYLEISDCPTISLSLQSCDVKQLVMGEQFTMGKGLDVEFPTNDNCNSSLESLEIDSCSGSTETIPLFSFNKLQKLVINYWESPNIFKFPNGYHQSLTSLQSLTIFRCNNIVSFPTGGLPAPNLKEFTVFGCNKLKSLPEQMRTQLSSLRELDIWDCPEMECFPDGGLPPSLESLDIRRCEKLKSLPEEMHTQLSSLRDLDIWYCPEMECFPDGGLPPSLETLHIYDCKKLKSLPEQMRTQLSSLRHLWILDCPKMECFPDGGLPPSLESLWITSCKKLTMFPRNWGLQSLPSLRVLFMGEFEDKLFPKEGLLPASLQSLIIHDCPNLEALNQKGFQDITSLKDLTIKWCPKLKYLPEGGLASSLSIFHIGKCPKLEKRIKREKGKDWPKVSHIPIIVLGLFGYEVIS